MYTSGSQTCEVAIDHTPPTSKMIMRELNFSQSQPYRVLGFPPSSKTTPAFQPLPTEY